PSSSTLSLHDALPIYHDRAGDAVDPHDVLLEQVAQRAGEAAEDHEHDGEAADEQGAAGEHAAGPGAGALRARPRRRADGPLAGEDRKSTRLNSSHVSI